jgi:hypothetical protein
MPLLEIEPQSLRGIRGRGVFSPRIHAEHAESPCAIVRRGSLTRAQSASEGRGSPEPRQPECATGLHTVIWSRSSLNCERGDSNNLTSSFSIAPGQFFGPLNVRFYVSKCRGSGAAPQGSGSVWRDLRRAWRVRVGSQVGDSAAGAESQSRCLARGAALGPSRLMVNHGARALRVVPCGGRDLATDGARQRDYLLNDLAIVAVMHIPDLCILLTGPRFRHCSGFSFVCRRRGSFLPAFWVGADGGARVETPHNR